MKSKFSKNVKYVVFHKISIEGHYTHLCGAKIDQNLHTRRKCLVICMTN